MAVAIYWPDGSVTRANDPTAALQIVASKQWDQPVSVAKMKQLLSQRAIGWNDAVVDPLLPDAEFLSALGETGMVFVTDGRHSEGRS